MINTWRWPKDCLHAGADVLVTKPWALNGAEARSMLAVATACGRRVLPWLPMRFSAEAMRVREIVRSGVLGEVFLVRRSVNQYAVRND